jgi:hypothetical protein
MVLWLSVRRRHPVAGRSASPTRITRPQTRRRRGAPNSDTKARSASDARLKQRTSLDCRVDRQHRRALTVRSLASAEDRERVAASITPRGRIGEGSRVDLSERAMRRFLRDARFRHHARNSDRKRTGLASGHGEIARHVNAEFRRVAQLPDTPQRARKLVPSTPSQNR